MGQLMLFPCENIVYPLASQSVLVHFRFKISADEMVPGVLPVDQRLKRSRVAGESMR